MKKEHKLFVFFSFYGKILFGDKMRFIKFLMGLICGILVIGLIINGTIIKGTMKQIKDDFSDSEYILVLGASVKGDKPSLMLKDRLDKTISLYNGNKIIVSGDHQDDDYDETTIMKKYLIENGIPQDNIIVDNYGISTYDSIYRLKNTLNIDKCIIVTQRYHLYRSIYIANKLDIEAIGVPAKDVKYRGQKFRELREFLARIKDFFKVMIKPSAKYSEAL